MAIKCQEMQPFRRLDPFAFPAETKGWFLILIAAALALMLTLGSFFLMAVVMNRPDAKERSTATAVKQQKWLEIYPFSPGASDKDVIGREMIPFFRNALWVQLKLLAIPMTAVLLLGLVSSVLYRCHPQRLMRYYKSKPLTREGAPTVCFGIKNWVDRLGLSSPRLEYGVGLAQGHAFGLPKKEILLLNGTPEILERSWFKLYRAIALHELAHIANGDAGDREKATAVWKALFLLLMGYAAIFSLFDVRLHLLFWVRVVMILFIVQMIKSGLVRTREFYADWRVSSWGVGLDLSRMLMAAESVANPWERWKWWWLCWERWGEKAWWTATWVICEKISRTVTSRFHPSFSSRLRVLSDSSQLFRISSDLPFLVGFFLALGLINSFPFLFEVMMAVADFQGLMYGLLLHGTFEAADEQGKLIAAGWALFIYGFLPIAMVSALLFGVSSLVVRTLGLQVQRQAVAQMMSGEIGVRNYLWLLKPSVLFALGIEAGVVMSPLMPLVPQALGMWAGILVWMCGMTLLIWLWLVYVYWLSYHLFGSHAGSTVPRRRQMIVAWFSALLLMILLWPALMGRAYLVGSFFTTGPKDIPWASDAFVELKFILVVCFVVLLLAIAAYIGFVIFSWLLLSWGPMRHRPRCSCCGREASFQMILGKECESCSRILTSWIFTEEDKECGVAI